MIAPSWETIVKGLMVKRRKRLMSRFGHASPCSRRGVTDATLRERDGQVSGSTVIRQPWSGRNRRNGLDESLAHMSNVVEYVGSVGNYWVGGCCTGTLALGAVNKKLSRS